MLHGWISVCGAYYLPVYYQVLGSTATAAGIMMLAFSVSASISSALAGLAISVTGDYRRVIWAAWAITLLGYGLMIALDDTSSIGKRVGYPLIAGIGLGPLFEVPMIAMQAAMPIKHMATSVAAYSFIRTMGSTVGVSVGQTIFTSVVLGS
jgi:MFS family permease